MEKRVVRNQRGNLSFLIGLFGSVLCAQPLSAAGAPSNYTWGEVADVSIGRPTHHDVGTKKGLFFVANGKLYLYDAEAVVPPTEGGSGRVLWPAVPGVFPGSCACPREGTTCCQPFDGSVSSVARAVTVSKLGPNGSDGVFAFVSNGNGKLYKVNADTGQLMPQTLDLRRVIQGTTCADALVASPVIHRAQGGSTAFQTAYGNHDLIYVATAYDTSFAVPGCSTHTGNKIFAIDAKTMTIKWSFGGTGQTSLDQFVGGCTLDAGTDTLYCGTKHPGGVQNSLIAISVYNKQTGSPTPQLLWARNGGDIESVPVLRGTSLFVANRAGDIRAFSTDGTPRWTRRVACSAAASCSINKDIEVVDFANTLRVLAVSTDGRVHHVVDTKCAGTSCGIQLWFAALTPAQGVTRPVVDGANGFVYVGANDGQVHQIQLTNGAELAALPIAGGGKAPADPELQTIAPATTPNRMSIGDATGFMTRFALPFTGTK